MFPYCNDCWLNCVSLALPICTMALAPWPAATPKCDIITRTTPLAGSPFNRGATRVGVEVSFGLLLMAKTKLLCELVDRAIVPVKTDVDVPFSMSVMGALDETVTLLRVVHPCASSD